MKEYPIMNKYLVFILLLFSLMAKAQNTEKPDPTDISDILSFEEFQEIKQFILDKGQTMTYCNMYNDNPYYRFAEDIELYLNPIVQFPHIKNLNETDIYNTIVIRIWDNKDYPFHYTDIKEERDTKKIHLSPYHDTEETMNYKRNNIEKFIVNILETIRLEKQP